MSVAEPTVLPVASRALVGACRRLGLDTAALLARAGVSPAALDEPEARLPAARADAIWQEAFAAAGDPHLALHAAEATPFGAFRVLDYLAATSRTLGEGLGRVAGYFRLIDPRGRLELEEEPEHVTVRFVGLAGAPLPPPAQEYTLAVLLDRARRTTSARWSPAEVGLAFPRPADTREHARVFGVQPVFGAAAATLVLPQAVWQLPTAGPDPALLGALDEHARRLLDAAEGDALVPRLREVLAAELPGGAPSVAVAARRLGTSARTLQRRLAASATSFAALLDGVRRERALALLERQDVSVAEVSWLVGFGEQAAFARAFRRWTGRSPSDHRRRRHAR